MATPKEVVEAAKLLGNHSQLPAIAIAARLVDGYDPTDPATLTTRSVILEPIVHPVVEAQLELAGATRRGRFTWSIGLGEESNPAALGVLIDTLASGLVYNETTAAAAKGDKELSDVCKSRSYTAISNMVSCTPAHRLISGGPNNRYAKLTAPHPSHQSPHCFGGVALSSDTRSLYLKFFTYRLAAPASPASVELNQRPAGRVRIEPRPSIGAEALTVLDWATNSGFVIVDSAGDDAVAALRLTAAKSVAVWPAHGRPAEAVAFIGRRVPRASRLALAGQEPKAHEVGIIVGVTAGQLTAAVAPLDEANVSVHPAVADVAAIASAPAVVDALLRDYQAEVVGMHLATTIGFVNTLAPGMGKTVTTLAAMRRRAEAKPGYRGLAIVEANVRAQWTGEAARFFPEATLVTIDSRNQLDAYAEVLAGAGDSPVLVITSYALASTASAATAPVLRTAVSEAPAVVSEAPSVPFSNGLEQLMLFAAEDHSCTYIGALAPVEETSEDELDNGDPLGALLLSISWDDLVADEAVGLRNTGSKLAAALWAIRARSQVAIALTGTPIVRDLDDLGRILSWVRNDRDLFNGARLEKMFDLSDAAGLTAYTLAIGPLVFRRDKSEISGEVPKLDGQVVKLTPSLAEKNLASAAQRELKRAYLELVSFIEVAERSDPTNPAFAQVREDLVKARGAWLGGTQLARMASSDPAALLGSESAGAALLASQGLVAAATAVTGTKRAWAVDYCTTQVPNGERILLFTEFATVANGLITDLRAAGLRVGCVLGGGGKARDADIASFVAGDLDLLVCTSAGERGLNLQRATTVIHYDLAWTPDSVVQRSARSARMGNKASTVKVVFPIMEDTIEERVAALVVSRAMVAMQALDVSRGIDASQTDMGLAFGDLALQVDAGALNGKESNMLALTRELLAA